MDWDLTGRMNGIDPKHQRIPQVVQDFLPPSLDGNIASTGNLENGLHLTGLVDFDRYETWNIKLDQKPVKDNKAQPMLLDVAWKNIDRAVPYIGWLKVNQAMLIWYWSKASRISMSLLRLLSMKKGCCRQECIRHN